MTMDQQQAIELVKKTFEADFNRDQFAKFISALCKSADFSKATGILAGQVITRAFQDKIRSYERITQHTDIDGNKIDILIVNLRRDSSLERARTSLRNFAAAYLNSDRGFGKAAVLVAYAARDETDYLFNTEWRFSYATLEKDLVRDEVGKFKEKTTRQLPARRYSFLVGADEQTHTAQTQFVDLLRSSSAPTLKQIETAFSVEKVTNDFYKEYEKLFQRTAQAIKSLRANDAKLDAHLRECCIDDSDFAKKLLGQIVFLYFLQRKGWFGVPPHGNYGEGDKRYLRRLFNDRAQIAQSYSSFARQSTNFFNNVLEPLFYQALAERRDGDIFDRFNAKIPFLNGGLFEPKYSYKSIHIELPDTLFSNRDQVKNEEDASGILDVFDRYNFTVNEAERLDKEVAIDPEMLGHVFENLLVKEERGQSGTFYTPQIIVSYMCRQSLLEYLATHLLRDSQQQTITQETLTRETLEEFIASAEVTTEYEGLNVKSYDDRKFSPGIRQHATAIDQKLHDLKVCDPAIGSGAFPVGILQEIVRLRSALRPLLQEEIEKDTQRNEKHKKATLQKLAKSHTPYALKLNAIENSIYGVDKEQSAVDIARLRLWLSLIVDEDDLSEDKSLPNLDYKIVQGNSLLNEFQGLELIPPDFVVKHSAQSLLPNEDRKANLLKLQSGYFAELTRSGKDSLEAHRIFRQIETLNKQIAAEKKTEFSAQGDLLQVAGTGKDQIKALHRIHQQIFQSKDKRQKDELRRQADEIVLEFINDHLLEGTQRLQAEITSTNTKLQDEIKSVRLKFKEEIETPKIKALTKTLQSLTTSQQQRAASQLALKNLWETNPTKIKLDLTGIDEANFTTSKPKDFTLWELQFVEMFFDEHGEARANGGFDILIANPPYIRQEKIKEYKAAFERRFTTYTGTADILVYFYEQAFNLLRQAGTLTFITSNKYFRAGYGAGLRALLGNNTQIKQIIDFGDAPVFEAAAYASIIVLNKEPISDNETRVWTVPQNEAIDNFEEMFRRVSFRLPQHELQANGWRLENQNVLRMLNRITAFGTPLGEYVEDRFYRGITTGLNEAFVIDRTTRDRLIEEDESSSEIIKPYLRGRDVKRWQANNADLWLIFTRHGTKIDNYPAVKKYLENFKSQLMPTGKKDPKTGKSLTRKSGIYKWFEIQDNIAYWEEFQQAKLLIPAIERSTACAIDEEAFFSNDKTSICITSEPRFLSAILNSSLSWWIIQQTASSKQNGYYEFKPMYVSALPIPSAQDWQKEIIETFVDYILFLTKADSEKLIVNYFESVLNALVYELFLADELHAADKHFFQPLQAEKLPKLAEHSDQELATIKDVFTRLSERDHPVRRNLHLLPELEVIRLIEGK